MSWSLTWRLTGWPRRPAKTRTAACVYTLAGMAEERPAPESFLDLVAEQRKGRLKIYVGAAAGVGKTWRMLEEAHELRNKGIDVVLGFIETHRRADTDEMVGDLEVVPRRRIDYRGVPLEEMDVDAILARKPEVAVVDELAHTNVAGSKHEKRYQDIEELLAAGINVITAMNIQHVESLNPMMKRLTGIEVRETVPDSFLARADQIVNVDVTVEALRERLREGKIYPPAQIEQALKNFFKPANLASLREVALREVARGLSRQREDREALQREGGRRLLPNERVMVGLSSNAHDRGMLLRKACRIAGQLGRRVVRGARRDAVRGGRANQHPRLRQAARQHQPGWRSRRGNRVAEIGRRRGRDAGIRARAWSYQDRSRPHAPAALAPPAQGRRDQADAQRRDRFRRRSGGRR